MSAEFDKQELTQAVQRYFDLMYDADTARFGSVFCASAQLHGLREGELTMWPAQTYKEILEGRQSPQSLGAPREEEILLMDFASPTQAIVKVRVRINAMTFVDYLTYHKADGTWMITSKAYHLECTEAPAGSA